MLAEECITKMVGCVVLEMDPNHTPIAAGDTGPFTHIVVGLFMPPKTHGALLVEVPIWDRPLDLQQGGLIR